MANYSNSTADSIVTGTSSADSIYNIGNRSVINAGAGKDTIINGGLNSSSLSSYYGSYSKINGDSGNDIIINSAQYVTIDGGTGDDTISNSGNGSSGYYPSMTSSYYGSYISINGGDGKDSIKNTGSYASIDGGAGADTIINDGKFTTYGYGSSMQSYYSYSYNNTIYGGKGNDVVSLSSYSYGILIKYTHGDGNDTIYGLDSNDTLQIFDTDYTTIKSGNDIIASVVSGSITLKDAATINNLNIEVSYYVSGKKISNSQNNTVISGSSKNDSIYNTGNNVTISSGAGDDTIQNFSYNSYTSLSSYYYGSYVSIDAGAGNDLIDGNNSSYYNSYVTINGGDGDDTISNSNSTSKIYGGNGNDSISNFGNEVSIFGGVDNDTILSYGYNNSVSAGEGNDSIYNSGSYSTINGDEGNDTINNSGAKATINVGAGNDSIYNTAAEVSINGGDGKDTIEIYGYYGYNYLSSMSSYYYGYNNTVSGGKGNDIVSLNADSANNLILYNSGEGNDTIYGLNEDDTLQISGASYTTTRSGKNLIVKVGNDSITIEDGANNNFSIEGTLDGGESGKNISNYDNNTVISGTDYADTIYNSGSYVSISGGKGNDTITHNGYYNYSLSSYYGVFATLNAGAGDDLVSISSISKYELVQYANGDGNDTIYGLDEDDTLQIKGAEYETVHSGEDLIFSVSSGKITVIGGANAKFKVEGSIKGGESSSSETLPAGITVKNSFLTASKTFTDTEINLATYENVTTINASAVSQGLNIVGNDKGNSIKGGKGSDTIIGGSGNDTLSGGDGADSIFGFSGDDKILGDAGNDTLNGGKGNNTLTGGKDNDIFVYDDGNDLITDYKPGEDKIQFNVADITSSTVQGSDVILTTEEGTVSIKSAKDKVITFIDGIEDTDLIFFADTYYAPLETGLTYDAKRTILTASKQFSGNEIDLENYLSTVTKVNASAVTQDLNIVANDNGNSIKGGKGADTISGGNGKDTLSGGDGADTIWGGSGDDKILGENGNDTLNGGTGKNTLTGGKGNDVFVYSGGNDLITDYKTGEDKIQMNFTDVTKTSVKGSDVILTTNEGTVSIKGAKDKVVTFTDYNGADTDLIFFADTYYAPLETGLTYDSKRTILTASKQFGGNEIDLENYLSSVTKVNASAVTQGINIFANDNGNSIKGGKGSDKISGGVGKDTLIGGEGDDSIYGGNEDDILKGDAGNDTLNGGAGNDTLTGGKGNDIFVYSGGNDLITDYKTSEDKIQINLADVTKSSVKGSDVILTTGEGTISIKGSKDKVITFTDDSGAETDLIFFGDTYYAPLETGLTYDAKRTVLTASNKFGGDEIDLENYLSSVTKLNASAVSQGINIIANDNGNSIKGGKFDDTISGGSGNDTLTGGNGADLFIYNGGNDLITDYKAGEDEIEINGTIAETSYSGKDVIFTIGNGNLTVKNAKDKDITVTDSSGTQTYSKTLDLLYDDNFVTEDFSLDEITEQKFEVQNIETQNYNLAQEDSILAYSEDK